MASSLIKGLVHPNFCQHSLSLMLFKTCMSFFHPLN